MSTASQGVRTTAGRWVIAGLIGGLIAGVIFAAFEMVVAAIMGQGFFTPLMMIGAIGLGKEALPTPKPMIGLSTIVPVGLAIHMFLSMIYGVVFGAFVWGVSFLHGNRLRLVGAATVFGLVLWIVNFYVIAPLAFSWFAMANPVVQFFAHTFFFGTVLGLLLSARGAPGRNGG
ncbi:hypothetical protein [Rubrobacter naiadicus]|uniref:hypothetical protein n=1 Tax=Rubrobacter naiadicus TaxID=1392641 RepID=UPI002362FB45|nr:hypothetical protein [Rubrobacter naiadicus]